MYRWVLAAALVVAVSSKPADEEKKPRVLHSPELSKEDHYQNDEHNTDYDHEAFLGEDLAHSFDDLSPTESKERLGKIVDKIDSDEDGFVTLVELQTWIDYSQKKYINEDVTRQWQANNPENLEKMQWENYRTMVYGFMDNMDPSELEEEDGTSYSDMLNRDKRRWDTADLDQDGSLTFDEYKYFLHPEEADHMRMMVVQETMEDIDTDKDGKISLEEYIGDMFLDENDKDAEEPAWVKNEREQFTQFRDKDGDGFMDEDEVKGWIIPPDYDHANAEAKHLIYEADSDQDEKLSKEEIINKYDLFVGSQATDFGEALTRHDEF
ncbi:unnamed protein product [Meganyctiphanes norvegica]|uniref:Reticulocalbin-3 n=1 Tax=Meganyctiphanes norvegica TaxID=48144 RepID=A0AAV2QSI1_MEGNR